MKGVETVVQRLTEEFVKETLRALCRHGDKILGESIWLIGNICAHPKFCAGQAIPTVQLGML